MCHSSTYHHDYLNDYLSSYVELLEKSTSVSMETKRLCTIVYEIFKTLNNLNPHFMKDIFHYSPNVTHKKHNLYIHTQNTTKFGNKSLRAFGANIWNTLPEYIKSTTSLLEFKKFIKTCLGPKYKCSVCKWEWNFLLNMIFVRHNILRRWIHSTVKHLRWSYLWKQLMT